MDIHRARFVPYTPAAINALAFSPLERDGPGRGRTTVRLAVGRANGDIEIWNPHNGAWVQETTFKGGKDRSVEGLVWIQDPDDEVDNDKPIPGPIRLFSIGYSSTVTEWNLSTGVPLRHSTGNHSEVWCFAAQPRWRATPGDKSNETMQNGGEGPYRGQNIVAGCADGTLVVLSTADGDLMFHRFLSRPTSKKARVLSLAFQNRDTVVAGFADSTIRVFNLGTGSVIRSMSLGAGPAKGPKEVLVWAVKCLPNGTIVAGDSTGEIRFYDGTTYTQLQRIAGHDADVLDLVSSQDGQTLFSAGMDRRTAVYRVAKGGKSMRWEKISQKRYHEHDVKALAVLERKKLSVVVSGGLDTNPVIVPLREFGGEESRMVSGLPQQPPIQSAPAARLVVSWWDREVRVWRIHATKQNGKGRQLVARLALKGEENITSTSVSGDGRLLAVATAAEIKVFQLRARQEGEKPGLAIRKLESAHVFVKLGARLLQFSADGKWLAFVDVRNDVRVARFTADAQSSKKLRILDVAAQLHRLPRKASRPTFENRPWEEFERTITRIQFSTDGSVLVAGDLAGFIDSWMTEGHEDLTAPAADVLGADESDSSSESGDEEKGAVIFGQHWIRNPSGNLIPRLDSGPLVLSFRPVPAQQSKPHANGNPAVHPTRHNPHAHSHELPHGQYSLLVLSAQHQIYEFDVLQGRLSDWSRRNPSSKLPLEFRGVRDAAMGCVWDVSDKQQRIWLYGSSWLCMLDLSQDFPNPEDTKTGEGSTSALAKPSSLKRKRKQEIDLSDRQTSGAGSKIPDKELRGLGRKMRKIKGGDAAEAEVINLDDKPRPDPGSDDDDGEETVAEAFRGTLTETKATNGASVGDEARKDEDAQARKRWWWCTYKYRSILGMVPISQEAKDADGQDDVAGGQESAPVEVVLVERPLWELDLPPRFVGQHERD